MKCGGEHSTFDCKNDPAIIEELTNSRVPEVIYWQSRALAAEQEAQRLFESVERATVKINDLVIERDQLKAEIEAAEIVNIHLVIELNPLKAELQQAREAAGLKNSSVSLVSEIQHLMKQADILERIEKA